MNLLVASFLLVIIGLVSVSSLSMPVVATETIILNPIADSYVNSDEPSNNYGAEASLSPKFSDLVGESRRNAYLLFDLTPLDTELFAISSATLELYVFFNYSPTFEVGVHSCQDTEWNEHEMTWENAPSFSPEPFDVTAIASGDTYYSWDVTDEVKNSQKGYLTLAVVVESVGDYYYINFNSKEAYDHAPELVIKYEEVTQKPPVASFTYSPLAPQVNDTIAFDASGSSDADGTIVSYLWSFGDGETSSSQNPSHAYAQEGSYTVTLTVTDNDGLTDTSTVSIGEVVIPEFPSYTMLLAALTAVAVAGILYKKKMRSHTTF